MEKKENQGEQKKFKQKVIYVKKPPLEMKLRDPHKEKPINLLCNLEFSQCEKSFFRQQIYYP